MDKEVKKTAVQQYLKYFIGWFIILGIVLVVAGGIIIKNKMQDKSDRGNMQAPAERVYDYAEVLTAEEEEQLRQVIAVCEQKARMDIVVVTINEDVESQGYWERVMNARADDFYDLNNYGYDKIHGDGTLLLDNYYPGQMGTVTSTCGAVFEEFGVYDNDLVLDAVYRYIDSDPYQAYKAFVTKSTELIVESRKPLSSNPLVWLVVLIIPIVVAGIFATMKLNPQKAKNTTVPSTYVKGGQGKMNISTDTFIRNHVSKVRIETTRSSAGGGSYSGGRGGARISSSGVSHGGGARRR